MTPTVHPCPVQLGRLWVAYVSYEPNVQEHAQPAHGSGARVQDHDPRTHQPLSRTLVSKVLKRCWRMPRQPQPFVRRKQQPICRPRGSYPDTLVKRSGERRSQRNHSRSVSRIDTSQSYRDDGIRHDSPTWNADHQRGKRDLPTRNRVSRETKRHLSHPVFFHTSKHRDRLPSCHLFLSLSKARFEELKSLAEPTQELQSETSEAERQTHTLFRESSSVALQTSTDLAELKVVTMVRRLGRARAPCCARSTGVAHLCEHEVWCWC